MPVISMQSEGNGGNFRLSVIAHISDILSVKARASRRMSSHRNIFMYMPGPRFIDQPDQDALTRALIERIVEDLWRLHGFNGVMDWVGATAYMNALLHQSHRDQRSASAVLASTIAVVPPPARLFGRRRIAPDTDATTHITRLTHYGDSQCSEPFC